MSEERGIQCITVIPNPIMPKPIARVTLRAKFDFITVMRLLN